jgi:NTE family protein
VGERRAVILGGGGVAGIAWATGILQGLAEDGVDLSSADAIIGTSAGSFVGAYLAANVVSDYFSRQFSDDTVEIPAQMSPETIEGWQKAFADGIDDLTVTARALGELALRTPTVSSEARAEVVAARLPHPEWPEGRLRVTAIDAQTGVLHLLDRDSGIDLITATAASGAVPGVWPPVHALGRSWIDGGSCSAANVALGAGYDKVVAIVPVEGFPGRRGAREDLADLEAAGAQAILIVPDDPSRTALGENPFDPSRRGPAAEAGRLQGLAVAPSVSSLWS